MKNKIQSYVGMRLGGCRLIDTLTTHLSPTNHPLKHGIGKYIFSFLLVLAMSIGQMWAADPVENVGTYSTQVISADGTTSTWTFITPSSQVTIPTSPAETEDNDIIFHPGGGSKMKFSSSNGLSWSGNSDGYIYVPAGAAGSISMTVKSASDSRWLQLYVDGVDQGSTKRLWSKEANPATAARGPRTFTFTSSDLTTKGEKTYLHLKDNNTEMKIATFTVTLTTGTYLTPSCSTEITTQPSGATLAVGDANPELSIVATNVASYAWKESSNGTSYDGGSTLASTASFTPEVNDAVQTKYYYCEVTSDCDGTTVVKSDIVTVNVVGSITYYTVTLNPAGGTIVDATGWTLNAGNYEKEVAEGTVLPLPTFTKENRNFKTWRKAGPADVASPVTVNSDLTLTAIWTATIESVIYSWEGAEGGAIETGGTASSSTNGGSSFDDAQINVSQAGYYCIQLNGKNDYSTNLVEITLSGDEKVKTGDKIKYTGFYNNADTKNAAPKMRAADGTAIFSGSNLPNITTSEPRTDTHVVPSGINTATVQLTRAQTQSSSFLANLQIIRDVQVEEGDLLTVTFDTKGGSSISPVMVASGQTIAKPADPTKEHNRFNEWQLSGSAYNFSTPVTSSITLDATWTPLYTVTYAANGGSGTMTDANEYAAGDEVTLLENTFEAPDVTKIWDSWAVTDALDNPVSVSAGKFAMPSSNATVTAQWTTISDFDVKFFQGYGDPDVQIGETQSISTGNYATAPAEDPERAGYRFLGWSYDATAEHIVNVSEYAITAATNFTAMWIQQFAVTFDGAGEVLVDNGATVASPNSPSQSGKVFAGWYNGESKYDFSAAVTGNLALESKWTTADANHYYYNYKDDFHFDGVVYKTPEGKVDEGAGASNIAITTPYTLFSGAEGITSIIATKAIYDSKSNWVNAYLKINTSEDSYLTFTIASGYTAVLKMKMGGYSQNPTVTLKKGEDVVDATSGTIGGVASTENNYNEITYNLVAGTYTMTTTVKTLYISHIDLEATAIPAHVVTYLPGEATGAEFVIDNDATQVLDCPVEFIAPEGKVFNGWKDALDNDVAVDAIVESDMTLTAQWIYQYAVTFNMNDHGAAIATQYIKHGAKATRPDDPVEIGYDFGGWFTDNGTFEVPFDFNTAITAATPLYAKWTAFDGCTMLYPATSGAATIYDGDEIDMQTGSKGATVVAITSTGVVGTETTLHYNTSGLSFEGGGATARVKVTLDHELAVGSKISLTLMANGSSGSNRALDLYKNTTKVTSIGWKSTDEYAKFDVETFTYTVTGEDGLAGMYEFSLYRNNSVILEKLTIEDCGDPIIFHNLTSAILPDNDPAYATVTLGASSVREGHTTTATYSDINAAYEFDEWQISGAGASIADASANPAVITMGTVDAVVTLKLKVATPKHTVTFNKMGTGDDVPSQLVKEGDLVPEPSVAEPEGWILEGWYKESTFETKWNFASDVMGTSDMELFAKWVADASIKLIVDGASGKELNAAAYYTGASLTTVEIADENHACVKLAGGATAATAPYSAGQNDNRVIAYCATTTATKIQVIAYSNTNSVRPYTISFVEEGQTADQADDNNVIVNLPTDGTIHTSDWYQFNSSKNRTIYITIPGNASNYHFLQVKVVESGTAIKKAGDMGYSMNFNVGRPIGKKQTLHSNFEGFDFYANNDYKVLQSTSMVISNATNDYIKFHAAAPMALAVTTENAASFYVTKAAKGTDNEILSTAGGISYIDLDEAADWYISPKGGDVKIQKIEFIAPKCAEPTVVDMENIGLCEGDAFIALTVSASVTDGGTLHYQWYKHPAEGDDEAVGTDAASYTPEADGQYYVVVTNQLAEHSDNSKTSNTVTVEHFASAEITTAPSIQRKEAGQLAALTVVATGKAPLTYQWYTCDDEAGSHPVIIEGADEATYEVTVTVGMSQYYKVVVGSGCGSAEAVTLVEEWHEVAPANVTGSRTWDWAAENMGTIETVSGSTEYLMANVSSQVPNTEAFRSDMLYITANYANRSASNKFFQGWQIRFYTEVPGKVSLNCRAIHGTMSVTINGTVIDAAKGSDMGNATTPFFVPAGWVTIAFDNQSSGYEGEAARVQKIIFNATPDYTRNVTEGRYGTICLPNGGVMVGAELFEVAYYGATSQKVFLDNILSGEMEAGVPYIFLPREGASQLGVFYTDEANASAGSHNGLIGFIGDAADEYFYIPAGEGNYILQNNLYREVLAGAQARILSNRAYIKLSAINPTEPALAPGRRRVSMSVLSEQVTTGMENIGFESEAPRKVLINGELFIIRGEKMFDAKGQLVK